MNVSQSTEESNNMGAQLYLAVWERQHEANLDWANREKAVKSEDVHMSTDSKQ